MNHKPHTVANPRKGFCHASVMHEYSSHQCARKAKNTELGHEWCQQQTPSVIQAKYEAKQAAAAARGKERTALAAARRKAEDDQAKELKKLWIKVKRLEATVRKWKKIAKAVMSCPAHGKHAIHSYHKGEWRCDLCEEES